MAQTQPVARLKSDLKVFVFEDMFIVIYVNDLFILSKDTLKLRAKLKSRFRMIYLNEVSHYFDIEVDIEVIC